MRKGTHSFRDPSVCVGFVLCKLLPNLAAAAAIGLRLSLLAAAAVSRSRSCFSSYLLLLCWLAAFAARLGEMVVFSSRVFDVLFLFWESVVCVSIEANRRSKKQHTAAVFGQLDFVTCLCSLMIPRCTC